MNTILALCGVMALTVSCGDDGGNSQASEIVTDITLKAQPSAFEVGTEGGKYTVQVDASREWTAYVTQNEPWITLSPDNGAAGTASLTIEVMQNSTYVARTGEVTIKAGSQRQYITIIQQAAERPAIACPLEGYNLVWHDEFESSELNTADWTYEVKGDHWVNNELQNYVRATSPKGEPVVTLDDGILSIHCFKEDGKVYSGRIYGCKSKGWQYGYVEASINLPSGKGTWPAFWMMPVHYQSWPHDGEIDIMEEVGYHPDYVSSSLHADGHVHSNNTQVTKEIHCQGAEGSFHTYGMEWTPDYFQFYVDGQPTLYYQNPGTGVRDWPYDAPFYVIFNLAWGGDWGGSQGVNEGALPVIMQVDWVRVWQK